MTLQHNLNDVVVIMSETDGIFGETGVIEKIDANDRYLPYRVRMDSNGDVYWYTEDEVHALVPGIVRTWGEDAQADYISEQEFVSKYMDEEDECDSDVVEPESDTYLVVAKDSDEEPIGFWTYEDAWKAAREYALEEGKDYGVFKMVAEVQYQAESTVSQFFS